MLLGIWAATDYNQVDSTFLCSSLMCFYNALALVPVAPEGDTLSNFFWMMPLVTL